MPLGRIYVYGRICESSPQCPPSTSLVSGSIAGRSDTGFSAESGGIGRAQPKNARSSLHHAVQSTWRPRPSSAVRRGSRRGSRSKGSRFPRHPGAEPALRGAARSWPTREVLSQDRGHGSCIFRTIESAGFRPTPHSGGARTTGGAILASAPTRAMSLSPFLNGIAEHSGELHLRRVRPRPARERRHSRENGGLRRSERALGARLHRRPFRTLLARGHRAEGRGRRSPLGPLQFGGRPSDPGD